MEGSQVQHEPASQPHYEWNEVLVAHRCKVTCSSCAEAQVVATDVNIGDFLRTVWKPEMFLRVVGTRLNGTVERPDDEVLATLEYVQRQLRLAADPLRGEQRETLFISSHDEEFMQNITSVIGAAELLLVADFRWDHTAQGLYFVPPADFHRWVNRKTAAVLRVVTDEINLLRESGFRRHTKSVYPEIMYYSDQFGRMAASYLRPDSYPTHDDALTWINIRDFFAAASGIVKDKASALEYQALADKSAKYLERVCSYLELYQATESFAAHHSNIVTSCKLSEDLQLMRYLKQNKEMKRDAPTEHLPSAGEFFDAVTPATTPKSESKQTPTSTSRSPITSQSPGVMVTRTPSLLHKKNAFQRALPSPQNLTREPRSQYAGLLNVVQNCFMNCLLQAYFGCRGFTDAVLRYPCDWVYGSAKSALPQAKLVQRLQAVFSFLETSRSACVNPEYVLESVGANNPQFMDGGQHDPHEFADAFIDMICEAFQMRAAADKDLEAAQGDLHELVYGETVEMSVDTHGRVTGDARVEKPLHFIPLYLPAAGELIRGAPPPVTPCAKGIAIRHETKRHVIGNATPMRAGPLTDAASPCARQLFEQPGNTGSLSALCDELDSTCQRGLRSVANLVSHATDDDGSSKAALTDEDLTTTLPTSTEDASLLNTSLDSNATLGLPPSSPAETSAVNEEYEKGIDSEAVKLYDALDQLTIDFKEGSTTLQATVKSFRKLPQLLMFYIPARTGGLEHRMLDFGAKIHLDRYKSDPEADTARDTCRQLLVQQKNLIQKRASHESLAQRLEEAIASVAAPELPLARDELVSLYNMRENHLEAALQSYEEVGTLGRSVYQVYDNLEKRPENTYCLHAVIVHKSFGQGGGHYFSYALDKRTGKKNRWVKFDDAKVTTVAEDEVFSDETRRNVYCMFYEAENSIRRSQDINVKVPDELTTLIQHEDRRWERRTARTLVGPQLAERTAEKPSIPLPAAMP